jgi:alanyl-tRNA synthetase
MTAPASDELRAAADAAVDAARKAYGDHGHRVVPPAPVVPDGDRSTLFVSAGIQVWRPWVLNPAPDDDRGRLGLQWCVRLNSLDAVGASQFLTSFCMLSTVAVGTVERTAEIERFLVFASRLGLDAADLVFGVADGSGDVPADEPSIAALHHLGVPADRIVGLPLDRVAPFGPDGPVGTEVFVYRVRPIPPCGDGCGPVCGCGRLYHFWNLEILEHDGRTVADCAGSLERLLAATSASGDVYATPALASIAAAEGGTTARVVADHCRTVALLLGSGIRPGPRGAAHVVRRLCRRAATAALVDGRAPDRQLPAATRAALHLYRGFPGFPVDLADEAAAAMVEAEVQGLLAAVERGRARQRRVVRSRGSQALDGALAAELHQTYGVPPALSERWLQEVQRGTD